jgi:hypothetical protein
MIYSSLARETAGPGELTLESKVSRRELTLEYFYSLNNSLISLIVGVICDHCRLLSTSCIKKQLHRASGTFSDANLTNIPTRNTAY